MRSYASGSLGRVAEVALGVVRVVQPPVGDRRAGDGGVEDVGAAQHGQRGQVAAEAPAPDRHPVEVELGCCSAAAVQRLDLVLEHRRRRGRGGRPAPTRCPGPACRGRRPRPPRSPGRRTTARWCSRCGRAPPAGRAARRRGRAARAAVLGSGAPPRGGAAPRSRWPALAGRSSVTVRVGPAAASAWRPSSGPPSTRGRAALVRRASTSAPRPSCRRPQPPCTPGVGDRRLRRGAVAEAPQRRRSSASSTGLAVNEHACRPIDGDRCRAPAARAGSRARRRRARRRAPSRSAAMTTRPSPSTAGTPGTSSTHASSLSSNRTVVAPVAGSAASTSTWRWSRLCTVSTSRSRVRPLHVDQVGERAVVPRDLLAAAVEAEHLQRDVGVGRAGGRVGVLHRRLVGMRGIGDPPAGDRGRVDAGGHDGRAVGRPPVAAGAAHLLGGDELGRPPRDLRVLLAGQLAAACRRARRCAASDRGRRRRGGPSGSGRGSNTGPSTAARGPPPTAGRPRTAGRRARTRRR